MEDHAENPTGKAKVAERRVVLSQWIILWDLLLNLAETVVMRKEIKQGKEDGKWLLHAHEAPKRPFPMILDKRLQHRWVPGDAAVCDDVLTCVIAVGRTVP